MPTLLPFDVPTRDSQALEAIRSRLDGLDGLWPIQWANRLQQATAVPTSSTDAFIVESLIGGPTKIAELPAGNPFGPIRERSRQVQYLLHAPVDSGLDPMLQASLIEQAIVSTPLTFADDATDGPITLMIDSVLVRPTRPATRTVPHETTPVIVAYRFFSV